MLTSIGSVKNCLLQQKECILANLCTVERKVRNLNKGRLDIRYLLSLAQLAVGNCLPLGVMPEGTVVCQVEEKPGDRGKIAKTSGTVNPHIKLEYLMILVHFFLSIGNYATVIAHNPDTKKTRVKLPSGSKKVSQQRINNHNTFTGTNIVCRPFLVTAEL